MLSALYFAAAAAGALAPGVSAGRTEGIRTIDPETPLHHQASGLSSLPLVINTWSGDFASATEQAWDIISSEGEGSTLLDAVEKGCNTCEDIRCGGSVGFGGHPDSAGEVTLDSLIMYGPKHTVGAVGYLRRIKNAATVARAVMEHTAHTMLVGEGATAFAKMMGMEEQDLNTDESRHAHESWASGGCQPNFYRGFEGAEETCPPYPSPRVATAAEAEPAPLTWLESQSDPARLLTSEANHDTIGMVVVDANGDLACGTTTNGLANKVAGRVGDSPVAGAGCYVDNDVGGAAATGDGDVMMRFVPSFRAVESMRAGASPEDACVDALCKITEFYPTFRGALICANKAGAHGAARHGTSFAYMYQAPGYEEPQVGHAIKVGEEVCSALAAGHPLSGLDSGAQQER